VEKSLHISFYIIPNVLLKTEKTYLVKISNSYKNPGIKPMTSHGNNRYFVKYTLTNRTISIK